LFTFKQLEAVYWVVKTGGFVQAATKLHTTQSAISKRVHDLEDLFDTPLFDRSQRSARLTEKGEEMFLIAKKFIDQRETAIDLFGRPETLERRVRIGVTELTAITWLPRLIGQIQTRFPKVVIEPDVDNSVTLSNKILSDDLDLIIVPDAFADTRLSTAIAVGSVENVWMSKPGIVQTAKKTVKVTELAAFPLLTQGAQSGSGVLYDQWFRKVGFKPASSIICNNLLALIGLTVSGLGVSLLPKRSLSDMVSAGLLEEIKASPSMPDTTYVALCLAEKRSSLIPSIITLAQECCDFTRIFRGV